MQNELKSLVRGAYDIQKLRIQTGNRLCANYLVKMGIEPGESDQKSDDKETKDILKKMRAEYKLLATGTVNAKTKFEDGVISNYTEYSLMSQYVELLQTEERHFRNLGKVLEEYPLWTEYFVHVKGVGPAMAGVILSEFDIHKAQYVTSLWRYAGLDVAEDGRGRGRYKEHLVDKEYKNAEGEVKNTKGITFNPWLKTKLMGVLADSFIRAGNEKYRKIYDDYKHRLENNPKHSEKSKGHRNNMAKRYMVKMFLMDLYVVWRGLEGLEIAKPYHEAKLGIVHSK